MIRDIGIILPFVLLKGFGLLDLFIGGIILANCIWHTVVLDGTMIFLAEIFLRPTVTQLEPGSRVQ